ncbi:AsmA-like C-terminal region-containing protein [Kordiimonas sp.]|uniref:YhdP family protein n=1 Tax=Kordiimonas sp. TaxID=1970157 RepID=UPI003A8E4201
MAVSFFFVRLLVAPVDLGFARDTVVEQTKTLLPGWEITFRSAEIGWDWRRVRPWVSLSDVQFIDRRERLIAFVPNAHMALTVTNVFTQVAISEVEIHNPLVHVSDLGGFSDASENGGLNSLFSTSGTPTPEVLRPLSEAFSRFGSRLLRTAPALNVVSFSNIAVTLERGAGFDTAQFTLPRLTLNQHDDLIRVDAILDAQLGQIPTQVRLQGQAEPLLGDIQLTLGFSELRPSALINYAAVPEFVSYFDVPLALDLTLNLSSNVGLQTASFSATMNEGAISDPISFPQDSRIRYGVVSGRYEASEKTLVFDQIEIATERPIIRGKGLIYWTLGSDNPSVQLTARLENATIDEVLRYWPRKTYPDGRPRGARAWIDDHVSRGTLENIDFEVDWSPETGGGFENGSAYRLNFSFNDMDAHYLLSMPPITAGSGQGRLTHDVFTLALQEGRISGMPVAGTTARMVDIDVRDGATGLFDVKLGGRVADVLDLLSYPPVNLSEKLSFDMQRVSGNVRVRTLLTLPLIKEIPVDAVNYDVTADILRASVTDLLGGEGLRDGALSLTVDPDNLSVEGTGTLNGVPLTLYWREDLKAGRDDPAADTTEIVLSGMMDEHDISALGVDVSDYLSGQTVAEASFIGRNFAFTRGYFSADVSMATLKEQRLAWSKPVAVPATVTGTVLFNEGTTRISPLVVVGEGIDVRADLSWQGGAMDAEFYVGDLGGNQFTAIANQSENGALGLKISGARFNLAPILDAEQAGKPAGVVEGLDILNLDVNIETLMLLNGEELDDLRLSGEFYGGAPRSLTASGLVHGTSKETILSISPGPDEGLRDLWLKSPDGGHFLRSLGLFAHLRDGELSMKGKTSGWGRDLHIEGEMSIKNALMVSRAKLSAAVTEGIIEGLNDYLENDAVQLDTIEMPMDYTAGVLDISSMKANGPSLGMTMEGQISARSEKINVNGVFVPAYGLNALLGKIPLLGNLLTGGEGKGIFGVAYRVKGPTSDPVFSVNPLSGIAPGFLRLLFEGRKGKLDDVIIPEEPENPSEQSPDVDKDKAGDFQPPHPQ